MQTAPAIATTTTVPTTGRTIPKTHRTRIIAAAQQISDIAPTALPLLTKIGAPYGLTPHDLVDDDALKAVKLSREQVATLLATLETLATEQDALQDVDDESVVWGQQAPSIPDQRVYVPRRSIKAVEAPDGPQCAIALDGVAQADAFPTAHQARIEVDMLCFTRSIGFDLRTAQTSFPNEVIDLAHDLAYRFFRTRAVRQSLDKARTLLRADPDDRRWSIDHDNQTIMVLPSSGTKSYRVSETCTCDDVWRRGDQHGGMCKHLALRVLLVLAQLGIGQMRHLQAALDAATTRWIGPADPTPATDDDDDANTLAFIALPATTLLAAGGFVRVLTDSDPASPVQFTIADQALTVAVGNHTTTVQGSDGAGQARITLDATGFATLWTAFRPQAQALDALQLFIDPTNGLNLFADTGDFQVAVPNAHTTEEVSQC